MPTPDHTIICGASGCGKTTLLKRFCAEIKARGESVIIFDPYYPAEKWSNPDYITADFAKFKRVFWASTNCHCIIDESASSVGRDINQNELATRSRHQNHRVYYVVHHINQLLPVVRFQCKRLAQFRTAIQGAKIVAEQYTDPELINACYLQNFEYYWKTGAASPAIKMRLPDLQK